MCLAVPMKIESVLDDQTAIVRQGETSLHVDISMLDDPQQGDFVIVHAGFAIETLEVQDAEQRLELFDEVKETLDE